MDKIWTVAKTLSPYVLVYIVVVVLAICFGPGCHNQVVLHPIEKSDIFSVPAGAVIVLDPNSPGALTVEKDGWFLSDTYVREVMDAKIK